jgi:prolyl-tRNA synthetase
MRLTTLFGKTLRQPPSEAHLLSHQLLVRAGYVRTLEGGLFGYLPLGRRTLERLQGLVRRALASPGGQEIAVPSLPDIEPAEALVRLVRREVDSYRQLPMLLFQLTTRPVPLARSRAGLFGASERLFAEIHAFGGPANVGTGIGGSDMAAAGQEVEGALAQILAACDLHVIWAQAGDGDRQALYTHPAGDEDLVRCPGCGYAAARAWAATAWPDPPDEAERPPEEIATPGCDTIAALAEYLDIPAARTLKMVFYSVGGEVTCVVIRGDRAVDEDKLARTLGTDQYYASLENELASIGAVGGYASPIGLDQSRVRVVADPSVRSGRNFVSGANRPDYHIRNVNVPRDFVPGEWVDLALVEEGDPCPHCGNPLQVEPAFALAYSAAPVPCRPEAEYLDTEGQAHPLWMASRRLDLIRLLAAVVESHHDDYGIRWPAACAPFDVYLLALDLRREEVATQAQALYERLQAEGLAVLYDDRDASAGVKFNDADLIGLPLRLTVSKRSVKDGRIEAKWRDGDERIKLDDDGLAAELARLRE